MTMMKTQATRPFFAALVAALLAGSMSQAAADIPFKKHRNGDLTIAIKKLTKKHMAELKRDIPGDQGKCVAFAIADFQDYGPDAALMRIPAERPGIEFEPRADGAVQLICGRFTEDQYQYDGKLSSSMEYNQIEGY